MAEIKKYLDADGVKILYDLLSLQDYPNNEVLSVVINAIDTTKLDKNKVGYIKESDGTVYSSSSREAFENEEYMGSVVSTQRFSMDLKKDPNNRYVFLSSDANKKIKWYFRHDIL